MSFNHIYDVARRFKAAKTLAAATTVLTDSNILSPHDQSRQQDRAQWVALQGSGLVEELMKRLLEPREASQVLCFFVCKALDDLHMALALGSTFLTDSQKQPIFARIPVIFHNSIASMKSLEDNPSMISPGAPLTMFQESIVLFIGEILSAFNSDEHILRSIDKEALLRMVFAVLFGGGRKSPQYNRSRPYHVRGCTLALASRAFETYASLPNKLPSVEDAVKQYGPAKIAKECAALSKSPVSPMGTSNIVFLFHYHDYPGVPQAFAKYGVHSSIAQSHWRDLKASPSPDETLLRDGIGKVLILARLLFDLERHGGSHSSSPVVIAILELLQNDEFFPLLAKALLAFSSKEPSQISHITGRVQDLGRWISLACGYDPIFREQLCRPEWSRIMQSLLTLERCHPQRANGTPREYSFAVEQWRELGKITRLDEAKEVTGVPSSRRSCSWIRCPLSLQESGIGVPWDMLQCSQCQTMQYCGVSCQRRDWKAGHQTICIGSARRSASSMTISLE